MSEHPAASRAPRARLGIALFVLVVLAGLASAAQARASVAFWTVEKTPVTKAPDDMLRAMAKVPGHDMEWAVGTHGTRALIERRIKGAWSITPVPATTAWKGVWLSSVVATSATRAWAVGYGGASLGNEPFAAMWNGRTWAVVPVDRSGTYGGLSGVTVTRSGQVWAVGSGTSHGHSTTLVEHWTGTRFAKVASPNPGDGPSNDLFAVAAAPGGSLYMVGFSSDSNFDYPIAMRMSPAHAFTDLHPPVTDPTAWRTWLVSAAVTADGTLWAGGFVLDYSPNGQSAVLLAYRNGHWAPHAVPAGVEAVGDLSTPPGTNAVAFGWGDAVDVWTGTHWRLSPPNPVSSANFSAVVATTPTTGIAVGFMEAPNWTTPTLAERYR